MRVHDRRKTAVFAVALVTTILLAVPAKALDSAARTDSNSSTKPKKVIIDADPAIGVPFKDVDDGLMLLVALNSPEIDILGITTTYGNGSEEVAYRKAKELVTLAGREDVPVLRGAASGDAERPTEASRFIAAMAEAHPDEVTVLAVGPMTNVAAALRQTPETAQHLKEVISMGGHVSAANVARTQCWSDLNYGSDKEAAGVFLESMDELTVVSIQLSERFYISPSRYQRLITETVHADYLHRNTRLWYWLRRRAFVVWDLVALACLIHPEWFARNDVAVDYSTTMMGEPQLQVSPPAGRLASVNIPEYDSDQTEFWDWVFSRL
jgi:inosine-uridine nucleoside N-ribohydrolase